MNGLIREAVDGRRSPSGLIDRLRGIGPLPSDRQERLNRAVANHEAAIKRGDEVAAAVYDTAIENLLDEARAAHREAAPTVGHDNAAEPPAAISFDGGVRRPVRSEPKPMTLGQAVRRELAARETVAQRARDLHDAWH